jgi:hypothetical protein
MPIKIAELTIIHNNNGLFSTISQWFSREKFVTEESTMVFLFDDGEVRDISGNCKDNLYVFTYLKTINIYYPSYFEKIGGDTYFGRHPYNTDDGPRLDFRNLFTEFDKHRHIPSIYNCIYYCHESLSRNDVFGILRCKSSEKMPRFDIAYDSDKFTKDEVLKITRRLFLVDFS